MTIRELSAERLVALPERLEMARVTNRSWVNQNAESEQESACLAGCSNTALNLNIATVTQTGTAIDFFSHNFNESNGG